MNPTPPTAPQLPCPDGCGTFHVAEINGMVWHATRSQQTPGSGRFLACRWSMQSAGTILAALIQQECA